MAFTQYKFLITIVVRVMLVTKLFYLEFTRWFGDLRSPCRWVRVMCFTKLLQLEFVC